MRSFACRDEQEREWLLEMHDRFEPRTRIAGAVFAVTLLVSLPWLPRSAMLLAVGALAFAISDKTIGRRREPVALIAGFLLAQTTFAVTIALAGRFGRGDLFLLIVPVIGAGGGFPDRVVVLCASWTAALMTGLGLALHTHLVLHDPPVLLLPMGVLATAAVLNGAIRDSSIEHRGAALIDPLTGMLNRLALEARVAELSQQSALSGQPVAVLAMDVDHFKAINDQAGHSGGDAVLSGVAYRIRGQLRAYDLAYRVGGEEFVVLLPGALEQEAWEVAEGIAAAIRTEALGDLPVTLSIGVAASAPGAPFSYAQVFAAADAALYQAKADGRDRVRTATGGELLDPRAVQLV